MPQIRLAGCTAVANDRHRGLDPHHPDNKTTALLQAMMHGCTNHCPSQNQACGLSATNHKPPTPDYFNVSCNFSNVS